jgi:acylpyruvate hydrolase
LNRDHIKELNNQRPKQPFFFLKPPSAILLPNAGPVLRPKGVNLHFEVELGLVIGKTVRDLPEADEQGALDAIESTSFGIYKSSLGVPTNNMTLARRAAEIGRTVLTFYANRDSGYLLAIDMTGRNVQDEAKKKGLPWSIAKGFDTFMPISNSIPKSAISNPHDIELWLSVNDRIKQQDSTELMLFRIPRQLSDISKVMTLEKGDIVLTGTPKGVGPVKTGDVMKAGMRVGGKAVEEASIEVPVADREGPYEFKET